MFKLTIVVCIRRCGSLFFHLPFLAAFRVYSSAQVESVLDKENFTLEELLDEEEIIQECKALNSRLINLLVLALTTKFLNFWLLLEN